MRRQIELQKNIAAKLTASLFLRKFRFINFELAGLLTFLIFCGLPIRQCEQWLIWNY